MPMNNQFECLLDPWSENSFQTIMRVKLIFCKSPSGMSNQYIGLVAGRSSRESKNIQNYIYIKRMKWHNQIKECLC